MISLEKDIRVNIRRGVHGRVATRLAGIVSKNNVKLTIFHQEREVDCSSVLDVLSMAFVFGSVLRFRVKGENAENALHDVETLFSRRGEP